MSVSVQSGAPVTPIHGMPVDLDGAPALSAESMLVYCQARLGGMDTEITGMMDAQRAAIHRKEVLNQLKTDLQACHDGKGGFPVEAYDRAIAQLPSDDPIRAQLEDQRNELLDSGVDPVDPDPMDMSCRPDFNLAFESNLSDKELKLLTDKVDSLLEGIGDDAEIRMIELQSLMSARQTAISLTTNILNKIQQSEQSVVDNIR